VPRNLDNETGKLIRSYADQGLTYSEVCAITGFSPSTVSLYTKGCGYQWHRNHNDIAELRRSGCSISEICLITGKNRKVISSKCRDIGLGETEEEKEEFHKWDSKQKTHSEEWAKQYIFEKSCGVFEYVSGYVNMDSHCIVRCTKCGNVEERSMVSFRNGNKSTCVPCKKQETKEKHLKEKEKKRIENESAKLIRAGRGKQLSFGFCVCGEMLDRFDGLKGKQCKRCAIRAARKIGEIKRRHKIADARVDSDITIQKLFRRDKGVCYLCGELCDWNDKEVRENVIVCGNQYPSIDHVVPLAKGGLHSWDNVRLAHRICNSLKADKTA